MIIRLFWEFVWLTFFYPKLESRQNLCISQGHIETRILKWTHCNKGKNTSLFSTRTQHPKCSRNALGPDSLLSKLFETKIFCKRYSTRTRLRLQFGLISFLEELPCSNTPVHFYATFFSY